MLEKRDHYKEDLDEAHAGKWLQRTNFQGSMSMSRLQIY